MTEGPHSFIPKTFMVLKVLEVLKVGLSLAFLFLLLNDVSASCGQEESACENDDVCSHCRNPLIGVSRTDLFIECNKRHK